MNREMERHVIKLKEYEKVKEFSHKWENPGCGFAVIDFKVVSTFWYV